jgi:hypothetical protein
LYDFANLVNIHVGNQKLIYDEKFIDEKHKDIPSKMQSKYIMYVEIW